VLFLWLVVCLLSAGRARAQACTSCSPLALPTQATLGVGASSRSPWVVSAQVTLAIPSARHTRAFGPDRSPSLKHLMNETLGFDVAPKRVD
jgi:hypothetical protein